MAVELGVLVRNCQFSNYLFLIPALLVTVSSTHSYFVHIKSMRTIPTNVNLLS